MSRQTGPVSDISESNRSNRPGLSTSVLQPLCVFLVHFEKSIRKRLDKVEPSDYSRITLKFPLQSHFGTILLLSFLLSLYHTDTLLTQPSTTSPVARGNKMTLPPQVCRMVLDFLREPTGSYYNVNSAGYEE